MFRRSAVVLRTRHQKRARVASSQSCMQVGSPLDLVADAPVLLTASMWDAGSQGHLSVGVRIPPLPSGQPAWNSVPQIQRIAWSADYHGAQHRLAIEWIRANQTAVQLAVTGDAAALANPRNGINITVGPKDAAAFSVSANGTWVNKVASYKLREGSGSVSNNAQNTDIQISGSAASGKITFLFVADTDVNADLLGADTGLSAVLVRRLHRPCLPMPVQLPSASNWCDADVGCNAHAARTSSQAQHTVRINISFSGLQVDMKSLATAASGYLDPAYADGAAIADASYTGEQLAPSNVTAAPSRLHPHMEPDTHNIPACRQSWCPRMLPQHACQPSCVPAPAARSNGSPAMCCFQADAARHLAYR